MNYIANKIDANRQILFLVHPGSLCGSANSNLGISAASIARNIITEELDAFVGNLICLDGELSDELPHFRALNDSIVNCIFRSKSTGIGIGVRLEADDPDHSDIAANFLLENNVNVKAEILITGAWRSDNDSWGCVNSTEQAIKAAGYLNVRILESAVRDTVSEPDEIIEPASIKIRHVF